MFRKVIVAASALAASAVLAAPTTGGDVVRSQEGVFDPFPDLIQVGAGALTNAATSFLNAGTSAAQALGLPTPFTPSEANALVAEVFTPIVRPITEAFAPVLRPFEPVANAFIPFPPSVPLEVVATEEGPVRRLRHGPDYVFYGLRRLRGPEEPAEPASPES